MFVTHRRTKPLFFLLNSLCEKYRRTVFWCLSTAAVNQYNMESGEAGHGSTVECAHTHGLIHRSAVGVLLLCVAGFRRDRVFSETWTETVRLQSGSLPQRSLVCWQRRSPSFYCAVPCGPSAPQAQWSAQGSWF